MCINSHLLFRIWYPNDAPFFTNATFLSQTLKVSVKRISCLFCSFSNDRQHACFGLDHAIFRMFKLKWG